MIDSRKRLAKRGGDDWEAAIKKNWPIVTDAAFDAITDELRERYGKTRDPFFSTAATALFSLRQEIARFESAWANVSHQHFTRLEIELAAHKHAVELLTTPDEADRAAA